MIDRYSWEQSGSFEVGPGVHRIPLPLPGDHLKAVNIYAVVDGDQVVLVDGGWALDESEELLAAGLREIGFALGDIREYLVTHLHRDHYTQAVALRRRFGGTVSVGVGEQACLEAIRAFDDHPDAQRLHRAGALALARIIEGWDGDRDLTNWEDPDHWLEDGVDIELQTRTLRVIHTPGHTRGHVVFLDREHDALFAGDHVLPHITPSIGVELNRPPSPLRDYLASLQIVRALPDTRLFPAHGPVTDSVHARIDELFAHHEERLTATAATLEQGASSGFEAATILTWTRRGRRFDELDTFNQILAVHETMAHLEVCVERGWLSRAADDAGVLRYSRA